MRDMGPINPIVIKEIERKEEVPYDLLVLADPSVDAINSYIPDSAVYKADFSGLTVGCYVLYPLEKETVEIKNIAVDEKYQGKGIGTILLRDAMEKAKLSGFRKMIIGTGNSSVGQLYLYQKVGFRITGIKPDFFRKNYKDPIVENGIECRDMIVLTREL
jgi:ribosomal protein S18 acetylase RimI-like enzyme